MLLSERFNPLTLWPPNYSIWIFTHLKLCLADAIHNFKWVKIIQLWQNGGQLFSNIADWCHILSLTCLKCGTSCANKKWKPEFMWHRRLRGQALTMQWSIILYPENTLNFPKTDGFRIKMFIKPFYQYMAIFSNFFTHIKSSSSTTSRELRQQFAACSGWRS